MKKEEKCLAREAPEGRAGRKRAVSKTGPSGILNRRSTRLRYMYVLLLLTHSSENTSLRRGKT